MRYIYALSLLLSILMVMPVKAQKNNHYNPNSFTSHGYLRTGLGISLPGGGEMVQFQLPETIIKSRFGNEANHYSELQFNYKYQEENSNESYEMVYMMTNYLEYGTKNLAQSIQPETSQLYFKWNNIYNHIDIWVGKRYYQRLNVDILDYFWLNPVQNADIGIGVEQINMGNGRELDLALIRFTDEIKFPIDNENVLVHFKWDSRLKKISLGNYSKLNLLGQIGYRPEIKHLNYKSLFGYTLGTWASYEKDFIYNRASLIYRKGINMIENPYSGRSFSEVTENGEQVYNMAKAYDIQITNDIRYDNKRSYGFLGVISYLYKDFGIKTTKGNERTMHHINLTMRFSKYLGNHFRITTDTSYGYVNITDTVKGGLFKLTLSPELNWKKGMFSRPSIRPFVTYARWSDSLKGQVGVFNGNDIYANKNHGFTVGIQMEIWW